MSRRLIIFLYLLALCSVGSAGDYNGLILRKIQEMPSGGSYARYRKDLPESERFSELYQTVEDLGEALNPGLGGRLTVSPQKAGQYSFCSSATYLLFCDVISELQKSGALSGMRQLNRELCDVGDKAEVIHGKLDGIGLFGHWNADGPGTAVLFHRLKLGRNFSSFDSARPGDFLKIFWNDSIGKGESGHLVVYLGTNEARDAIQVWSSNLKNEDGSSGYGSMWVERKRIARALFSRFEEPKNLSNWLDLAEADKTSRYLVQIRETGSTGAAMKEATGSQ